MTITSRAKAIAFFITLGACLVALTIARKARERRQRSARKKWMEVDFAKVDCEEVELARTSHHLKAEELHLESVVEEEMLVRGNAEELRTPVHNLFDTARKYSDEQKDI